MPGTAAATGRAVRRASALALGLVASAGVLAPPALAAPAPIADVSATTGSGAAATVHVRLVAAPVPADLDLSGARFDVLDGSGAVVGSCASDASGACDVPMAPSPGTSYRLVQDAGSPVPGLVPSTAEAAVVLCPPDVPVVADCANTVTDASLFRTGLSVTVRDGDTQAPVAGVEYSLTGPDYRHAPAAPQGAETTTFPAPMLSGPDGRLTFAGWFLPGDWALTPEVTPRGYQSSGVLPVTLPARTADSGDTWAATVDLARDAIAPTGTGNGPARPPVVPPKAPGPTAPARTPVTRPAPSAPSSAAVPSSAAPTTPAAVPTVPAAPTDSAPLPRGDDAGAPPPAAAAAPATDSPPIRAAAASSRLDAGVIGFWVLFLASVVVGVRVVRRRVRQR